MNIGRPRQFSEEFRQQILALRRSGMSIVEVGLQLGINKKSVVYLTPPEFLEEVSRHANTPPLVKAWLTSGYNKSMTLEEFLEVTK